MLWNASSDSFQMSDTVSIRWPFSFIFNLGNKAKSQGGQVRWVRRRGNNNNVVVSHKLCCVKGLWRERCHDEEDSCGCSKLSVFFVATFSFRRLKNDAVKVRFDRCVRRNNFTMNTPLHVEKNNYHALCWTPDSDPRNRPWRPIWLWDIKDPTLSRQSAHS
jgi:hypothetical protein